MVYAVREEREGESWFKMFTASLFYRIIYRITDVDIPLDTGDFRLLDRKVVDVMNSMRERHRFLRGMAAWVGFRQPGLRGRPNTRSRRCSSWRSRQLQDFPIFHCSLLPIWVLWLRV